MKNMLKLTHHKHSGRLRPHEYTSYGPLIILLLAVGIVLAMGSVKASPGPTASSVGLTGVQPGPAPTTAAVITSPTNGSHFTSAPITVSGTCPASTLVEVLKNSIFAGSSFCTDSGTFSFEIDPLFGENQLVARVYDALNQAGPNSEVVTIFYDILPAQASSITPFGTGTQLILNADAVYRGIFPDQRFTVPIEIIGGTPPFALNVEWGDSNNEVVPRTDNQPFTLGHAYSRPGTYAINLQASDAEGRVAFLTVAAIVNGQPTEVDTEQAAAQAAANKLLAVWPLYVGTLSTVTSFWLGERREKHILEKHGIDTDAS